MAKQETAQMLLDHRMAIRKGFIEEAQAARSEKYRPMLVLGAGVSKPAKLPGWQELVSKMFGYGLINVRHNPQKYRADELPKDLAPVEAEIIDKLVDGSVKILNGNNVLETGQYVEEMLDGFCMEPWVRNEELKEILTRIIDQGTSAEQALSVLSDEEKNEVKELARKSTLQAVAYLLSTEHGFQRAITYNYDTYVEEYMYEIYGAADKLVVHVDGWNQYKTKGNSTDIFHVHGCVPTSYFRTKPELKENAPRESKGIILSEDSYYDVEDREIYNWMNSVQSSAFNQNTCIFVGFSGEDYNFRRILRQLGNYEKANRPKHYMLVNIKEIYQSIYDVCKEPWNNDVEKYSKVLLDRVLMAKEGYWGRFGFYPIWVTVDEIPDILLSLAT